MTKPNHPLHRTATQRLPCGCAGLVGRRIRRRRPWSAAVGELVIQQAMPPPPFEEFAEFVRAFAGLSRKRSIVPSTRFEGDLGITGDDGCDLLRETETQFGVALSSKEHGYRLTFGLGPDEYLFHAEGLDLFGLSSGPVREFTAGELYDAVCRASGHESTSRV